MKYILSLYEDGWLIELPVEGDDANEIFGKVDFGLGEEDPDLSPFCTRNAKTCTMIVDAKGMTKERRASKSPPTDKPCGTCMIAPKAVGLCKYLGSK